MAATRGLQDRDYPFVTSAPGKIIVFGEHAVVHGKAAIAAAISLRSYLLVSRPKTSNKTVQLVFPDITFEHEWRLGDLPWSAFDESRRANDARTHVTALDEKAIKALQPHVQDLSPTVAEHDRRVHQAAASAFLYLLLSLSDPDMPSCAYTMRSTIPIASGLGSSASMSVCISTALLHQAGKIGTQASDRENTLEEINKWGFVGELCTHGNPSGLDNTVASRGKAVLFKRAMNGNPQVVTPLHDFPELPMLLVDTKQARSTSAEVAKVGRLKQAHPGITEHILDAINNITESAHSLITSPDFRPDDAHSPQRIGELARVNHGLLLALGVSHPRLERIRELVDHDDIGWTKLTGAGGGGCAFTILRHDNSDEKLRNLESRLDAEGFARYETTLGGVGVGLLRIRGEENEVVDITEKSLRDAVDVDAVERLVGITAPELSTRWHFWT
ncbi:MAG: Mevalonate kinase [Chrysothrix sp. TS-e1954]|nr:MAG: Mevalonate kinase [Chrysothrix sp. TS-e1954]